ncbi:GntR family transcriptional regulator [Noviherbaspirillum denitrificans]|uniref:GntR family transcriptional regulator n=1 Tax=Noviherbaspirillum denitrificans TaxID=1968433 RepID=A0A254TF11_9BURK|nr:GntR family transcriptional regulator [Noviherbaspirillum denitrificans]OWW21249.1 GntR family transcriptional regulator [Noviherbaspirillum denitrificans]
MPKANEEKDSAAQSANEIANDIAAAIAGRKLPPGTKLREEALARVYSVSRTKIRAALLLLSKDKLIDIVPDKGAFVSQPTEKDAREIFAARRIIEAAVVKEFVAKAQAKDYKALENHLKSERAALSVQDSKMRSQLLGDFHVLLAQIAGNQVLAEILAELVGRSSLITMLYQSDRDAVCSSDEHADFLAAAKAGKVDKAVSCMLSHLDHVEAALQFDTGAKDARKDLIAALLA